jgi:hypothetical protein
MRHLYPKAASRVNRLKKPGTSHTFTRYPGIWPETSLVNVWTSAVYQREFLASVPTFRLLFGFVYYFKPSFFPAASNAIDSRMRLSRVSSRLAV